MSKTDILFVHPNAAKKIYQGLSSNLSAIEPPIWAGLIANHVRTKGYNNIHILDCEAENLSAAESAKTIEEYDAKLVVFVIYGQQPSASTQNMQGVHDCLEILKEINPNRKVLLTGLYPSAVSRKTMQDEKADFVCQGEGPHTITALMQVSDLSDPTQLKNVPGLWYRENGVIRFTKPAPLITQDQLAYELPVWLGISCRWINIEPLIGMLCLITILPLRLHLCIQAWVVPLGAASVALMHPLVINNVENWDYGRNKFRFWDPDFMITEFDKINELGIRNIKIADEMFVLYKDHFMKLCEKITERQYDFNIWAYARIDTVKPQYLDTLKKAGVEWLALGIESGNKTVRKDVVKGRFTEIKINNIVKDIQNAGINVIGNYIFGLPEDDLETMQETLDMAKDLNCEFSNFYCTMAYPGSKLYLDALKHNWTLPESYTGYSQHSYDMRPLDTNHLHASEVVKFRDFAFHDYHEDPKYLQLIKDKFGQQTHDGILKMCEHKLKRQILGD